MATNSSAWPASRPGGGIRRQARREPYCSGRGDWWQKITCKRRDSFVVVGFEPSTVPGHLGGLLLARAEGRRGRLCRRLRYRLVTLSTFTKLHMKMFLASLWTNRSKTSPENTVYVQLTTSSSPLSAPRHAFLFARSRIFRPPL